MQTLPQSKLKDRFFLQSSRKSELFACQYFISLSIYFGSGRSSRTLRAPVFLYEISELRTEHFSPFLAKKLKLSKVGSKQLLSIFPSKPDSISADISCPEQPLEPPSQIFLRSDRYLPSEDQCEGEQRLPTIK